ncbi:hypothetical protein E4U55_002116 [Claviceps digitariae]|nr:hypothetical protein E4U55_002116 [Claviceps digitariae]
MCTTELHTYVYPDGHTETFSRPSLCAYSRHNQPCSHNNFFHHAPSSVPYGHPVAQPAPAVDSHFGFPPPPYGHSPPSFGHFPPSPSYSYHSGDDSDRPFPSPRGHKPRPSGMYAGEHPFAFPSTAPSSPSYATSAPYAAADASSRGSTSRRQERERDRPSIKIEIIDSPRHSKHVRHSSNSSNDSRHSRHSASEAEKKHHQALKRGEQTRQDKLRAKIAKANAEIASREAVPAAPAPAPKRSSTSTGGKPPTRTNVAQAARDREEELLDAVHRLNIREKTREKARREEEEAQRQRLIQRMSPGRRATVGPGGHGYRAEYDGVFR